MFLIDNLSIIRIFKWFRRILPVNLPDDLPYQFVPDFTVAVNIIRGNAGLSTVQKFTKHDTSGCQFQIASAVNDTWTFSS